MNKQQALELLGLPNNPSEQQIKQACKVQVKQWHPDKAPEGKTEEYTERFKLVKQAEEYLLNHNKKSKVKFGKIYEPIEINTRIQLTIEELMFGIKNKQVVVLTSVPCEQCDLTGVSKDTLDDPCPMCKGEGSLNFSQGMKFVCMKCQSTGVNIQPCKTCRGTGGVKQHEPYTFNYIPPGVLGLVNIENKQVLLTTNSDPEHEQTYLDPETGSLQTSITVSYPELVLGTKKQLTMFGGKKDITITIPPGIKQQQKLKIKEQGIPWTNEFDNNLYVQVVLDETINWTDKQKKLFEEIITPTI